MTDTFEIALSEMAALVNQIGEAEAAKGKLAELRMQWAPQLAVLNNLAAEPVKKRRGRPPGKKTQGEGK